MPPASGTLKHAQILSVVTSSGRAGGGIESALRALHAELLAMEVPFEIVVVDNTTGAQAGAALRRLADELCDLQVYRMRFPVDDATARLAGIENAIGDWVACVELDAASGRIVRQLYDAVTEHGIDIALAQPRLRPPRPRLDALLSSTFHALFRTLHGFELGEDVVSARIFSRAVINSILDHDFPLVAMDVLPASVHVGRVVVRVEQSGEPKLSRSERIRLRWRTLIGINAAPLRVANALCGLGAVAALLYSVYVVLIYLFKDDVIPGWTTVSLMLSAMFLLLSLVLWLLSEYMVLMLDARARRPRYDIAEEFASNAQTRQRLRNVEVEA